MATGFVIKETFRTGKQEYFQGYAPDGHALSTSNICLAWGFRTYEEAEKQIEKRLHEDPVWVYQIEKIFFLD